MVCGRTVWLCEMSGLRKRDPSPLGPRSGARREPESRSRDLPVLSALRRLGLAHVRSLAACWAVVGHWWPQPGVPSRLGDLLKIMPADDVHAVMLALAIGGLVDPADVPEPPSPCD